MAAHIANVMLLKCLRIPESRKTHNKYLLRYTTLPGVDLDEMLNI